MTATKEQADFALIRQNVSMRMLLQHYGITGLKGHGNELRGPCPIHQDPKTGNRSFQVNIAKNIFHCFYCKVGGNVIDFVAKKEGCNLREAGLKIQAWFLEAGDTGTPPSRDTPEKPSRDHQQPAAHQPDAPLSNPLDPQPPPEPATAEVPPGLYVVLEDIAASLRTIAGVLSQAAGKRSRRAAPAGNRRRPRPKGPAEESRGATSEPGPEVTTTEP